METREEDLGSGIKVVALAGKLNASTVGALEEQLLAIADAGARAIILDMAELTYISSAGLRTVLVVSRKMQASGGSLKLCALRREVKDVFDISGFSTVFSLHESRDDALSHIQAAGQAT